MMLRAPLQNETLRLAKPLPRDLFTRPETYPGRMKKRLKASFCRATNSSRGTSQRETGGSVEENILT